MGASKKGPFDIPGDIARKWLLAPTNPNGLLNLSVIKPLYNAIDITRRPRDMWVVDFGTDTTESDAAFFELPYKYILENVKPIREKNNREAYRGTDFSWGRGGIAAKTRYAFGILSQGFQRRPFPDAMPSRQHTR
jgi:hypothetical protein